MKLTRISLLIAAATMVCHVAVAQQKSKESLKSKKIEVDLKKKPVRVAKKKSNQPEKKELEKKSVVKQNPSVNNKTGVRRKNAPAVQKKIEKK